MKKCLALILMLCLLTVNAFAAAVVQDGIAPEVVGDAAVTLVDVGEYDTTEDADLAAKLETALKNLPENPDAVFTDLFFATVEGEVTVTFKSDAVGVMFSTNGTDWTALEAACNGETVTVTLKENGVVLFLQDAAPVAAEDAVNGEAVDPEESTNFTPSVSGKLAPEVKVEGDSVADIMDATGNTVAAVPAGWMVLTPLATRAYTPDVVTFEGLEWAYASVLEGADPMLQGKIVSDLFDLAVYGEYDTQLAVEGNVLVVTFAFEGDNLTVLCSDEIGTWHELAAENVKLNGDGTVTLTLEHEGVLAFAVEAEIPAEGTVTAP